jgi:cob(I)alamin adenosyltransferase
MVRIDRVVTRGGDGGQTSLGDGARVAKDDLRVEAYGTVDEANAAIGLLRLHTASDAAADAVLARAQNDLFDIGADLCVPGEAGARLRVDAAMSLRASRQRFQRGAVTAGKLRAARRQRGRRACARGAHPGPAG